MDEAFEDADLDSLLAELDLAGDPEHPDVSVTHESGWTLTAFASGLVTWENVEGDGDEGHRNSVSRAEARRLFGLLAQGQVEAVAAFGWAPGYGH